ncbi:MAG: DUF3793 family protein [Lachnospiraceae bacterium]|nr:DUF3793 family protein [Lachnospiraceae bacterium]
MPDKEIVEHCSPTLAGLKTANLFSVKLEKGRNIVKELRDLNATIRKKGLRAVPVRCTKTYVLVYLYRPERLKKDLNDPEARELLCNMGYDCSSPERCLAQLVSHLTNDESFPHEIGLFLGYPPIDVKGFMNDTRGGVKCSGCWKVYGNEKEAKKTFKRYKKCTDNYRLALSKGHSLLQLIV